MLCDEPLDIIELGAGDGHKTLMLLERLTAAFNLYLPTRINREFGANFSAQHFQFRSNFDFQTHAAESWLISLKDQQV